MNSSAALKRQRILNLIARIGLCTLILILGTMVVPLVDEKEGLALADASVRAIAASARSDVLSVLGKTHAPASAEVILGSDTDCTTP